MWGSSLTRMHKKNPPLPTLFFLPSPLSLVASPTPLLSPTPHPLFHSRLLFSPLLPLDDEHWPRWWRRRRWRARVLGGVGAGVRQPHPFSPTPRAWGTLRRWGAWDLAVPARIRRRHPQKRLPRWRVATAATSRAGGGSGDCVDDGRGQRRRRQPPRPSPREME